MSSVEHRPEFEGLVEEHYKALYYFALNLAKSESDASDLTQQTYLKLAKNWEKIRDMSKVKSWLFSTLYREFLNSNRRRKKFPECDIETVGEDFSSCPERVADSFDAQLVLDALSELKESLRAPLSLYYLESYSYQEIAKALELPVGTVMSRLYRGKAALYEKMSKL